MLEINKLTLRDMLWVGVEGVDVLQDSCPLVFAF